MPRYIPGMPAKRSRTIYYGIGRGNKVEVPDSFTRKKSVPITVGGRWKVRQLLNGYFLAYRDGKGQWRRMFASFSDASNYAHAQATIARHYNRKYQEGRRNTVMRELYRVPLWAITERNVMSAIYEENDIYTSAAQD